MNAQREGGGPLVSAENVTGGRIRIGFERLARLAYPHGPRLGSATLLDHVCELMRDQLVALGASWPVLAAGEVDVCAGRERPRRDRPGQRLRCRVGVDADVGERLPHSLLGGFPDLIPERSPAAARA